MGVLVESELTVHPDQLRLFDAEPTLNWLDKLLLDFCLPEEERQFGGVILNESGQSRPLGTI